MKEEGKSGRRKEPSCGPPCCTGLLWVHREQSCNVEGVNKIEIKFTGSNNGVFVSSCLLKSKIMQYNVIKNY
jgi:hypothetical protein